MCGKQTGSRQKVSPINKGITRANHFYFTLSSGELEVCLNSEEQETFVFMTVLKFSDIIGKQCFYLLNYPVKWAEHANLRGSEMEYLDCNLPVLNDKK